MYTPLDVHPLTLCAYWQLTGSAWPVHGCHKMDQHRCTDTIKTIKEPACGQWATCSMSTFSAVFSQEACQPWPTWISMHHYSTVCFTHNRPHVYLAESTQIGSLTISVWTIHNIKVMFSDRALVFHYIPLPSLALIIMCCTYPIQQKGIHVDSV